MEETNLQKEKEEVKVQENNVTTEEDTTEKPWHVNEMSCKSARTLYTVGTFVLVLGIIFGVILFICTCTTKIVTAGEFRWSDPVVTKQFNPISLVYLVCDVFSSVIFFALAHAVADITENTHKLANKTEKD